MSSAEFAQAMESHLFLPSSAVRHMVGEKIQGGGGICDAFGDRLTSARLAGDGWRRRHNVMKRRLGKLLTWANIQHEVEVFNMFSHLIPKEGLSQIEVGRKRQALVPDLKIKERPTSGRG